MTGLARHRVVVCFLFIGLCFRYSSAATMTNASMNFVVADGVMHELGTVTLEMIDHLRAELWLQVPATQPDDTAVLMLSPLEVLAARGQHPAIVALAGQKMARIQRLTLGTAPEFVEVGKKYVLFYEGVARGTWGVILKLRLKRADDALKKLARLTLARKAYLDEAENRFDKP